MFIDSIQILYYIYSVNPHKRIVDSSKKIVPCGNYFYYHYNIIEREIESVSRMIIGRYRDVGRALYEKIIEVNHTVARKTDEDAKFVVLTDNLLFMVPSKEYLQNKQFLCE